MEKNCGQIVDFEATGKCNGRINLEKTKGLILAQRSKILESLHTIPDDKQEDYDSRICII